MSYLVPFIFMKAAVPHHVPRRMASVHGLPHFALSLLCMLLAASPASAGSATWLNAPGSGDWNTAGNWTLGGPPNGALDVATFDLSTITGVSLSAITTVDGLIFNAGASTYTITATPNPVFTFTLSGTGILNNSGVTQNFVTNTDVLGNVGVFVFLNNATAGTLTAFTNNGGTVSGGGGGRTLFGNNSSAANATFTNNSGTVAGSNGGTVEFFGSATAASATITNNGGTAGSPFGGFTFFYDTATAGNAAITNNGGTVSSSFGGRLFFGSNATAGTSTITNNGGTASSAGGSFTQFNDTSTAGDGNFTNNGGTASSAGGGYTQFNGTSTAASGNFINNGGTDGDAFGGQTEFNDTSTAAIGVFTNNGGTVVFGDGGGTEFNGASTAANGLFINNGGMALGASGGFTRFNNTSTAAFGAFTNNGGIDGGGITQFFNASTAGNGLFTNNGGTVFLGGGGFTQFFNTSTAGNAILIANGGVGGGFGGSIVFLDDSTGGTATVRIFDNGELDISQHNLGSVAIGSIEGTGNVFLGANNLTVGGNGLNTLLSGAILDSGLGGSFTKTGPGTLTLSGGNVYSGATTIEGGALKGGALNVFRADSAHIVDATLDLGGFDQAIGSLEGASSGLVTNSGPGGAILTTGGLNTSTLFQGMIADGAGSIGLTKLGTGTLTLTSINTHTGDTTVNAGVLATGDLPNSRLRVMGGSYSPGNVGTTQTVTVNRLSLDGGNLLFDLAAGGVSDHLTVTDGLAALTTATLFTFNDLGVENGALYHLIDGLDIANPWNLGLLNFTGPDGSFLLSPDFSELLFVPYNGSLIGGPILQNSAPIGTSITANFLVNGAVRTGSPIESNTIRSLTFNPGSSLQVFNNLTVTSGDFTVNSGRAVINGGRVIVPGDFNKNGGGTLVANTYLQVGGNANINQGALRVNGTLEAGRVNVFPGALLGGSGLIIGDVFNSGTVAPGNSPGTLSILGNYTQTSIGTLQIEIASETVFDRLVVSGTARLDGTLDIRNYHGNTLSYGQQVPFLQAGRIVGTFDEILMPEEDLFRGRFLNAGHTGILLVAPTSYTLVAKTPNQTRAAKALDSWIGTEDGDIGEVTLALDLLTLAQYPAAFEAIMPGYYEAALNTGIELSQNQGQLLFQQLSSRRLGQRSAPAEREGDARPLGQRSGGKDAKNVAPVQPQLAAVEEPRWNGWMQGSGLFSDGGLSLNPGEDFESGTFMVGADYALGEHVSVGLFASYQEGWGDYDNGGDIDLESVRFGGYATVDFGGFYANGAIGGGTTDYSVKRPIQWATLDRTARSNPDGREFFTMLGTGYDFHAGNFTFGPSLSAQYTKLKLDEFAESGADALDLRVREAEEESLRTYLGGRIAYTLKVNDRFTLIPELRAFWEHEFLQGGESISASLDGGSGPEFRYLTEEPGKDAMYVGAGLNFEFGENFTTSVYYHANFGRNDDAQHTVSVSANWRF